MLEKILFGGCSFWCLEPAFAALSGVENVVPGYAGGRVSNPTKELVQTGTTGHVEVVKLDYNPEEIPLSLLLDAFFSLHDPERPPAAGQPGRQYASVVYCGSQSQQEEVRARIERLRLKGQRSIRTEVKGLDDCTFWRADPDDLQYYFMHGAQDHYCIEHVRPVLRDFTRDFWQHLNIAHERRDENPAMPGRL